MSIEEELGAGFRAATIAHIERVLVEENQHLRQQNRQLQQENHELALQVETFPKTARLMTRMRQALAGVSWAESLEEARRIASEGLGPGAD